MTPVPAGIHGRPPGNVSTSWIRRAAHTHARLRPSLDRLSDEAQARSATSRVNAAAPSTIRVGRQPGRPSTTTEALTRHQASARSAAIRPPGTCSCTPSHPAARPAATAAGRSSTGSRTASLRDATGTAVEAMRNRRTASCPRLRVSPRSAPLQGDPRRSAAPSVLRSLA